MIYLGQERPLSPKVFSITMGVRRWIYYHSEGKVGGHCGIASNELVRRLNEAGYHADLDSGDFHCGINPLRRKIRWYTHCWVRFQRVILDVTADQFNHYLFGHIQMRAIVFGSNNELKNRYSSNFTRR